MSNTIDKLQISLSSPTYRHYRKLGLNLFSFLPIKINVIESVSTFKYRTFPLKYLKNEKST